MLCVDAFGVRLGVRSNAAELLAEVPRCFPAGWRPTDSAGLDRLYSIDRQPGGGGCVLYQGDQPLGPAESVSAVLARLEYDIELHVAEWAPERVFVHAGVVGWRGRAIVIPGRSFSGKSTLVGALCAAGADYYSDEFAVLDSHGLVHPFLRRLNLRQEVPGVRRRDTNALNAASDRPPLPIGVVVLTGFEAGARWSPQRLTAGQALLGLLSNTMCGQSRPHLALATLRHALEPASALRGPRGEAAEAAQCLLHHAGFAG